MAAVQELQSAIDSTDAVRLGKAIAEGRQHDADTALIAQAVATKTAIERAEAEARAAAEQELRAAMPGADTARLATAIDAARRLSADAALIQRAEAAKGAVEKRAAEEELRAAIGTATISTDLTRLTTAISDARRLNADAALIQQAEATQKLHAAIASADAAALKT